MRINGYPRLACHTKITKLDSRVVTVEPMFNFPIIRDLVTDFTQMFATHKRLKPYIISDESEVISDKKECRKCGSELVPYDRCDKCHEISKKFCMKCKKVDLHFTHHHL
jgi:succinate dehydrogenase / fumarate reductase iron-sulfur subunit